MDKIENNKCCACSACYSICPTNAISMNIDEKGFKRPVIDKNKCINCGLCEKTCAFNNKILIYNLKKRSFIYGRYFRIY